MGLLFKSLSFEPSGDDDESLAARWWRWVLSASADANPVDDPDGRFASWNQPDDVWFLAGTFGGQVTRSCGVPVGRTIFVPAVNTIVEVRGRRWSHMRLPVEAASVTLDSIPVPVKEVSTRRFQIRSEPGNGYRDGESGSAAWGLWSRLLIEDAGSHELRIQAKAGPLVIDTTYRLAVSS
jgi:hypothetical protein